MALFGASVDTPDDNRKFAESLGLDFPLLSDPERGVAADYGVVTPDRQFASRWTFYIGVDGKLLHIEKKVSPATAGQDVAAKLAELGIAGRK